jgi:hypothetical protein
MKAITLTTRNVLAGERNTEGEMVLHAIGDVTVTLEGMLPAELADWHWAAAALNTRGWDEAQFLLTVRGWKVLHDGETVGILLQGAGTRVHVEWYDKVNGDFFSAAWTRNLRQGAAQIVFARLQAGQGLTSDVEPEPYRAPEQARPVWLENGTQVRYHGSIAQLSGETFRVYECARFDECDHWDCNGYALIPVASWRPVAVHVGLGSVTALEPATA